MPGIGIGGALLHRCGLGYPHLKSSTVPGIRGTGNFLQAAGSINVNVSPTILYVGTANAGLLYCAAGLPLYGAVRRYRTAYRTGHKPLEIS